MCIRDSLRDATHPLAELPASRATGAHPIDGPLGEARLADELGHERTAPLMDAANLRLNRLKGTPQGDRFNGATPGGSWIGFSKESRKEARAFPVSYTHLDGYKRQRESAWATSASAPAMSMSRSLIPARIA